MVERSTEVKKQPRPPVPVFSGLTGGPVLFFKLWFGVRVLGVEMLVVSLGGVQLRFYPSSSRRQHGGGGAAGGKGLRVGVSPLLLVGLPLHKSLEEVQVGEPCCDKEPSCTVRKILIINRLTRAFVQLDMLVAILMFLQMVRSRKEPYTLVTT